MREKLCILLTMEDMDLVMVELLEEGGVVFKLHIMLQMEDLDLALVSMVFILVDLLMEEETGKGINLDVCIIIDEFYILNYYFIKKNISAESLQFECVYNR